MINGLDPNWYDSPRTRYFQRQQTLTPEQRHAEAASRLRELLSPNDAVDAEAEKKAGRF